MDGELYDLEKAFWRAAGSLPSADPAFEDIWPSETRGDGAIVKNNRRTGAAQGKGTLIRKAHCRLCGFPNDLVAVDHSGGSIDGEGAGGSITTAVASAPVSGGGTHTEAYGSQSLRRGAGCALCFSKNSTVLRIDADAEPNPWDRIVPLGF